MSRRLVFILLVAALVACATAQFAGTQQLPRHPLVEMELDQWQRVGKVSSGAKVVDVTFAIKQSNLDVLERKLKVASMHLSIVSPRDPNRGQQGICTNFVHAYGDFG